MLFTHASTSSRSQLHVLFLKKGVKKSPEAKKFLHKDDLARVESFLNKNEFKGEKGETSLLHPTQKNEGKIILMGLGDAESNKTPYEEQFIGGSLAKLIKKHAQGKVYLLAPKELVEDLAYGISLGRYEFEKYQGKSEKQEKQPNLEKIVFLSEKDPLNEEKWQDIHSFDISAPYLRDMVNTPTNDMNTETMVKLAQEFGKKYKCKVTVFDEKKLRKLGCHALVGVGQGALYTAKMILIEYKFGTKEKEPNLALLGKGVVFDTGGYNIKPTGYMETMKEDMTGAATVLATLKALAESKVKGYFLGVLCCAENSISDKAQRPGDVVKAYNGKSIEITNTDAEGRLCLADGLAYVEKNYRPKKMLDIATLTGAVSVALGYNITGVMGNNANFNKEVMKAFQEAHERAWELPLNQDFIEACKGKFTDLVNSSDGVRAGTIMGAAFLNHFVEKTPWVHLDIGGTAWADKPSSLSSYGATAACLRTLYHLAKNA